MSKLLQPPSVRTQATARRAPLLLFLFALLARLLAWPTADVEHADAVTRALLSESTVRYPGWVGDGVWLPLHFYLNGIFIVLCDSRVTGPVLLNILLGSAIVFPVFQWARRWSNGAVACAVTLVIVFNPLVFRNSLQCLSEVPFLFFSACAFNSATAGAAGSVSATWRAALAGACITIAAGIRYEAWLFIPWITLWFVAARQYRLVVPFACTALLFPIAWMTANHLVFGNPLSGVQQVIALKLDSTENLTNDEHALRSIFFPLSFLITTGPVVVLLGIVASFISLLRAEGHRDRWWWLLPFPLFLMLMVHKAMHGQLILQHRFTTTLLLLFVPYLMLGFGLLRSRATMWAMVVSSMLGLWPAAQTALCDGFACITQGSWAHQAAETIGTKTLHEIGPVPQLNDRLADTLVQRINAIRMERKLLVLDFFGWQNTYNTAFRADVISTSIVFLPPEPGNSQAGFQQLSDYLDLLHSPQGVIVLDTERPYTTELDTSATGVLSLPLPHGVLELTPMGRVRHLVLFKFTKPSGTGLGEP